MTQKLIFGDFGQEMCHSNLNPAILHVADAICQHQDNIKLLKFYLIVLNPLNSKLREKSQKKAKGWPYSS